jgi:hypothetical protein
MSLYLLARMRLLKEDERQDVETLQTAILDALDHDRLATLGASAISAATRSNA